MAAHLGYAVTREAMLPSGESFELYGPDSYMRAARAEQLLQTGAWYDPFSEDSNAPYGERLHWTRPLDAVLVALAWPLSLATDQRTAMLWAASLVSPLFSLLAVLAFSWATRPFLSGIGLLTLVGLLAVQNNLMLQWGWARSDHHGLLATLAVLQVVLLARQAAENGRSGLAWAAGGVAALAMWVSVEALVLVLAGFIALGILWLAEGGRRLGPLLRFAGALTLGTMLAVTIEKPPSEWLDVVHHQLSVVHVGIAAVLTTALAGIRLFITRGTDSGRRRALAATSAAGFAVIAITVPFPEFWHGPMQFLDPEVKRRWLDSISEFQPLLGPNVESLPKFVLYLGVAFTGVPYAIHRLRRGEAAERKLMLAILAALALFLPLTVHQVRWSVYVQALATLPAAAFSAAVWEWAWQRRDGLRRGPLAAAGRLPVFLVSVFGYIGVGMLLVVTLLGTRPKQTPADALLACSWRPMTEVLTDPALTAGRRLTLMSFVFEGPELLFRTGHRIVGTPYGNTDGILDTFAVFEATDPDNAREILIARNVDAIVYCRRPASIARHGNAAGTTFLQQLEGGTTAAWLRKVSLPPTLADRFAVFLVTRSDDVAVDATPTARPAPPR